jgi:hypothetical protein
MKTPHLMTFLALPTELRLLVYSHVFLVENFFSDYESLRLTCRQVKTEIESECLKYWRSWLKHVEETWKDKRVCDAPASMEVPHTFRHVGKLVIHVPILILGIQRDTLHLLGSKSWNPLRTQMRCCKATAEMLRPLFSLYLGTLTLQVTHPPTFESALQTFRYDRFFSFLSYVVGLMSSRGKEQEPLPNTNRLVLDFSTEIEAIDPTELSDETVWGRKWRSLTNLQEIWTYMPSETDKRFRVAFNLKKGLKKKEGWIAVKASERFA